MGQKIITLSGAATDVLYALFFRGALTGGDLPSKSGAAELRELGFAESRHTATKYHEKNFFTFLTAEGQEFAIKHLANTRFGVPAGGYIGNPLHALDEIADLPLYKIGSDYAIQKKIADALDTALARHYEQFGNTEPEKTAVVFLDNRWVAIQGGYTPDEMRDAVEHIKRIRKQKADEKAMAESSPYFVKDGQVFIKDAFMQPGTAVNAKADSNSGGSTTYNCNMHINIDGADKTIREKVHAIVSSYLTPEATEYTEEMVDELMSLKVPAICDESALVRFISEKIEQLLQKETRPGGSIYNAIKR